MLEIKEPKQFLELYNRFIFRSRVFLESKKTNEKLYFSHPFEESIIIIRKRPIVDNTDMIDEVAEVEEDDLFDEYDRYGDDEESQSAENVVDDQVDVSMESKLLRYSIDDMNTWLKYNQQDIVKYVGNQKVYICDIFGHFYYELNIFNHCILMDEFKKINSELEYFEDEELFNQYYSKTTDNTLCGVKLVFDQNGNQVSKSPISYSAVEFYGEKFVSKFMELNSSNLGADVAESVLQKTNEHSAYLGEFSKHIKTIEIFESAFNIEKGAESIPEVSKYSKLGIECCNNHDCFAWFKTDLEKLSLPQDETYYDELKGCFENFGLYLNNYFEYAFLCDKHLNSNSQLKDAHNAIKAFFEDPLYHPKNNSTFSAYLTEKGRLQFVNYFKVLIEDLQKFSEEYQAYAEKMGDFSGSFVGGGFGVKGAIKGILTASVANAIESGIYQAVEYGSIKHKYVINAIQEYARTQASKDFLLKLLEIDCKLITYALPAFLEDKIDQFFGRYTGNQEEERFYILDTFFEASKYYTVYLAKKYKLNYIPNYTDENGKKLSSLSNVELLENAICTFPYETEYYTEYLNIAPDKACTCDFLNLMRAFDVDKSITNNVEETINENAKRKAETERLIAERKEKERQEFEAFMALKKEREEAQRKAQEALEAAERERLEEERRKREEERQKKFDELATIYGSAYSKHEAVFKTLIDNDIFMAFFKKQYSSSQELINDVDSILEVKPLVATKFLTNTSPRFKTMLQKAKSAYADNELKDEDVLLVFDATVFGNAKNGFVLAKNTIYANGMLSGKNKISLDDINMIFRDIKGVNIGKSMTDFFVLAGAVGDIGKILVSVIANQFYINEKGNI